VLELVQVHLVPDLGGRLFLGERRQRTRSKLGTKLNELERLDKVELCFAALEFFFNIISVDKKVAGLVFQGIHEVQLRKRSQLISDLINSHSFDEHSRG
jgi:hypothetical protein